MSRKPKNTRYALPKASEREAFCSHVWKMGGIHARNTLPWRHISDAYAVYVSEVMLQQTQVARVLKYWPAWMKHFPTIDALAAASTSDVLERWQGLGYNRRALGMKKTAEICSSSYKGQLPQSTEALLSLPGIGPATAAGIQAFAYQLPSVYIETNVRAVFIHHFFAHVEAKVPDKDIIPLVEATLDTNRPRDWYYALLDYGAHLKQTQLNPSRKAQAYTPQSPFEGSRRQKRSFLVREVLANPGIELQQLQLLLDSEEEQAHRNALGEEEFGVLIEQLVKEGFFSVSAGRVFLP